MKTKKFILLFLIAVSITVYSASYKIPGHDKFQNVIIMIGDGMTASQRTLARWYKKDFLVLDRMYRNEILTNSADSLITDSGAAATAYATGCKTTSWQLGILPPENSNLPRMPGIEIEKRCLGEPGKPVITVLEAAKLKGKSIGLVVTSEVQDATPAGFSTHVSDRDDMMDIAKQQVYQDIDVVFGGGKKYLLPKSAGGVREEGDDLTSVLKERGYLLISNLSELKNKDVDKVWGIFAPEDLAFDMDRKELNLEQPPLVEMTNTALEILDKNPEGFFLMVEGSKIDWAAHDNDPVGIISDLLAFDEAVNAALEFAANNGHTLVLALSDHGTGGMSLGSKSGGKIPYHTSYNEVFEPLKKAILTSEGVTNLINDQKCDTQKTSAFIEKYYGIGDLASEQLQKICEGNAKKIRRLLGQIISERSLISWTTTVHTGEDIILFSDHPIEKDAKIITLFDNTEIALLIDELLDLSLNEANEKLYMNFDNLLMSFKGKVDIQKRLEDTFLEIVLTAMGKTIRLKFPFNTDICVVDAGNPKTIQMKGITIYSKIGNTIYVPYETFDIIKSAADSAK